MAAPRPGSPRLPLALVAALALGGLGAVGLGLQQGARPSGAEVIARYAAIYLAEAAPLGVAPRRTDCQGAPATGDVWLIVACAPRGGAVRLEYHVDRRGRLLRRRGGDA